MGFSDDDDDDDDDDETRALKTHGEVELQLHHS
jgi:hypothetical protein